MKINFKKLLESYNLDLTEKLRGFGEEDYLKFWVPDTVKVKSIQNLIDALYETGTYKATIDHLELSENEMKALENLKNIAIESLNAQNIELKIDPEKYKKFKEKNIITGNKFTKKIKTETIVKKLDELKIDETIDQFYINLLSNLDFKFLIEDDNNIKIKDDEFVMKFSSGEKLIYYVNKQNEIIENIKHIGLKSSNISKILEILCRLVEGKKFQEVSEHSIIYLDYDIRSLDKNKNKINGIHLPSNSCGLFNLINKNFKENYYKFLKQNKLKETINKHYYTSPKNWNEKSTDEKTNIIQKIIKDEICTRFNIGFEDIVLARVIQNNRLEFILSKRLFEQRDENILFKIEDVFKNKIDKSIELLIIEEKDFNKLRLTNAPKTV